ncbi:MAG: cysteine synthase A [Psychrilyobacter sp.]|nr:cysteine synthase A [Psychrilyobacter sp.]
MKILNNILESVGNTPIIKLNNINDTHAEIYVKVESFNPAGSTKDRVALNMIEQAEKEGTLKKGDTIIETTSGNTGIGLSMVCAVKGYNLIIIMPDSVSIERRMILDAYGTTVILTDGKLGMKGALEEVEEQKIKYPNCFIPDQFSNIHNPDSHYNSTGPEILESFENDLDVYICGTGTGGSFTGTAKYLKEKLVNITTIAVEPDTAPFISKGITGSHKIQGMGMSAGYIPKTFDSKYMDEITTVSYESAKVYTNRLAREEGILGGISSGANVAVAIEVAKRPENKGKKILTVIMDTGERYLSSGVFE